MVIDGNIYIKRKDFSKIRDVVDIPDLIEIQKTSYRNFLQLDVPPDKRKNIGLQEVFNEVFPIDDYRGIYSLRFVSYSLGEPKYDVEECIERGATYAAPLRVKIELLVKEADEETDEAKKIKDIREQEVYMGELPLMTEKGTFIINGAERVVVSQLHRSPGVYFSEEIHKNGKKLYSGKVIPYRGAWLELKFDINDLLYVHIDKKRKILITVLLRALGYSTNDQILELFCKKRKRKLSDGGFLSLIGEWSAEDIKGPDGSIVLRKGDRIAQEVAEKLATSVRRKEITIYEGGDVIKHILERDEVRTEDEALEEILRRLRLSYVKPKEGAMDLLRRLFFDPRRYNLADVGRYNLNKKLGTDFEDKVLRREDIVGIVKYLIKLRDGEGEVDDIDHLGNRRVRSVGELLQNQFRIGLARMEKAVREKMSLPIDAKTVTPYDVINTNLVTAAIREFFNSSQLSQFMDQINPLAELTHKRRLSALGPGGLSRDRAGFEVRDVHPSHYGRICPIETPEGPNIGLIVSLSTYARTNEYGFLETPYREVRGGRVTNEIRYLSADKEIGHTIAQANAKLNENNEFVSDLVMVRRDGDFFDVPPGEVDYMDVSPKQLVSVSTALIPFLEHDDANRALMGSNMQRQAVPLLRAEPPLVGTGMEHRAAKDSGAVVVAKRAGKVTYVSGRKIVVRGNDGKEIEYNLIKFKRSNQGTCINQKPIVRVGDRVKEGQVIADGAATSMGELALGRNVLVAFLPWYGYNYEDAVLVSERLVREDIFSSIHIEEFEIEARDTKLGKEEITREIPGVGEDVLKNLDENGIVRIGAEVGPNDILVGKVTPKEGTEPTPEEKLLRAIFGEKAGDVRDASLRVPPGNGGIVIGARIFSRREKDEKELAVERKKIERIRSEVSARIELIKQARDRKIEEAAGDRKRIEEIEEVARAEIAQIERDLERDIERLQEGSELAPGVVKMVKVYVAKKRKLTVGDKLAGRHGNKGVIAKIVPVEDMPYLEDGTPVDVVLNPLGVPSRMNVGQILETHLGWAAHVLNTFVATPVFDGATEEEIKGMLREAGLPESGRVTLYNGYTGEPFDQKITVGYIYMMKLVHLAEDKIHARSIGPYSLVTQQPLGGRAQFGGQRFGEMEVWALEAYGAAYALQEMLTVKSDDVTGRTKTYEAIVKGKNMQPPGTPESFNVLVKELQSLGLNIEPDGNA
ncbi:MAG: DNA-directed RNA polymerase subunit beta [bacterium]